MNQNQKLQSVVHYMSSRAQELKGALPERGLFNVSGVTISESARKDSRTMYGSALDIVVELIDEKELFGWYLSAHPNIASFTNGNAELRRIKPGERYQVRGEVYELEENPPSAIIRVRNVKERRYLDNLRTLEGYVETANLLNIKPRNTTIVAVANSLYGK